MSWGSVAVAARQNHPRAGEQTEADQKRNAADSYGAGWRTEHPVDGDRGGDEYDSDDS